MRADRRESAPAGKIIRAGAKKHATGGSGQEQAAKNNAKKNANDIEGEETS
jgi:hypothetical protein